MIVVDANIMAYLHLPGQFTAVCEGLLQRDGDWVVPTLWRSEFRNILAGHLRQDALSLQQAMELQLEAEALVAGSEFVVDSVSVLELVRDSDCSAYDCEYVALAKGLGIPLVTMDRKLIRTFPDVAVAPQRL